MRGMTITLIALLKRRPDLSKDEFIARYEGQHRLIGEKVLGGYVTRYVRRFIRPVDGVERAHDPDVVMEMDFPDQATMEACFVALRESATAALIAEDEKTLFDRSRIYSFTVEEHASQMPPVAQR